MAARTSFELQPVTGLSTCFKNSLEEKHVNRPKAATPSRFGGLSSS